MKICPNCGTTAEDGAFYCPSCQGDLPASSIIPQPEGVPHDPTAPAGYPPQPEQLPQPEWQQQYPPAPPAPPGATAPPLGAYPGQYAPQPSYPQQAYYPQPAYGAQAPVPLDTDGMPMGVKKFAWGALLFGWIWCAVYGLWAFLGIDLALSVVSGLLRAFEEDNAFVQAVSGILGLGTLGWRIYLGFAGPRVFWQQNPTQYTVERWNRHQRNWGIAAIIYVALICLCIGAVFAAIIGGLTAYQATR